MDLKNNKIEFDIQEIAPLLIGDKQEGFCQSYKFKTKIKSKVQNRHVSLKVTIHQKSYGKRPNATPRLTIL